MTPAEIQLDLYANRPGGFGCGAEKALYGIALSLRADLAEARTKLEIGERQNLDLDAKLTERTQQLNGLLAALDYDEKAVPALASPT
jgi:hypothetical protein